MATAKCGEEFLGCASIALDFRPDNSKISCELMKTARIASATAWLRFDGSMRLRFSSTIRTRSPTQVRLTLYSGNKARELVSNYACREAWRGRDRQHFAWSVLFVIMKDPQVS